MADYPIGMELVVDPDNPMNVVVNGSVGIYAPEDVAGTSLLPLKDLNGFPLANPLTSNAYGFTPGFLAPLPQVRWKSGEFSNVYNSYIGLRDEAIAAKNAAQDAQAEAASAGANAAEVARESLAAAVADADDARVAAEAAAALVGTPADAAVAAAVSGPTSSTRVALNATYKQKEDVDWRDFSSLLRPDDDDFDSTAGVNQMIAEAMAAQKPMKIKGLVFCGGTINAGTAVSQATPLTITGASTGHTSLGPKPDRLVRPAGMTHTLMKAFGHGLKIENITFDGIDTEGDLLEIGRGFEPILRGVFFYRTKGHGLLGRALSNATIENVGASRCGSPSAELNKAAMRITGNSAFEYVSNSTYMANIRLERNPGTDLDLGYGLGIDDGVEFFQGNGIHIEGVIDGTPYLTYKTDPMVKIGNVRGVEFNSTYLYGGAGTHVRYEKLHDIGGSVADGVTFNGGTLMGHLINHAVSAGTPDRLVDLVSGDNFSMNGTIFDTAKTEHIRIRSTFGKRAWIIAPKHKTRTGATTTYLTDDRPDNTTARERFTAQGADFSGDVKMRGLEVGASGASVAGNLTLTAGMRVINRTVTTSQILTTQDDGVISTATNPITLTLPASSNNILLIKNLGTKALTIAAPASGTAPVIDGATSLVLMPGDGVELSGRSSSVGSWFVVSRSSGNSAAGVPAVAPATNLGVGGTAVLSSTGNDRRGAVTLVAGSSATAAGVHATVTFSAPFSTPPYVVPSSGSQNAAGTPFAKDITTTGFNIGYSGAPAVGGTYVIGYEVIP